jgi:FkbM family methyltransferase
MFRVGAGLTSRARLIADVWLTRLFLLSRKFTWNKVRNVFCHENTSIRYRLNRGDLQGIREVWCEHAYRLPFEFRPGVLVDLGANIGLTSLWLNSVYHFKRIIAVEPDSANAALIRENFALNSIAAEVIEAAVGPRDGKANFVRHPSSNQGQVARTAVAGASDVIEVSMVSMDSILAKLPEGAGIDVLKVDIEGGEAALFLEGPREWLKSVKTIIAEFHPGLVDCDAIVRAIELQGFDYIAPSSIFPGNMTAFVRRPRL